jgi:peptidoglycan L-alanyl-D-glutamate endopeptidase CwlK
MDAITLKRIDKLHPKLREEARKIYADICKVLTGRAMCRFTYTLRTMSEQNALYAQGRTVKGAVVTNAKGGQSYHNYGLAVDIAFILDGKTASWNDSADFDGDKIADWMECVKVFKAYGWEWGGDWQFKDRPHFQKTFGHHWKTLLDIHNKGKVDGEGYVLI